MVLDTSHYRWYNTIMAAHKLIRGIAAVAKIVGVDKTTVYRDVVNGLLFPAGSCKSKKRRGGTMMTFDNMEVENYKKFKQTGWHTPSRGQRIAEWAEEHGKESAAKHFRIKPRSVEQTVRRYKIAMKKEEALV
jgi:hypothetical protein